MELYNLQNNCRIKIPMRREMISFYMNLSTALSTSAQKDTAMENFTKFIQLVKMFSKIVGYQILSKAMALLNCLTCDLSRGGWYINDTLHFIEQLLATTFHNREGMTKCTTIFIKKLHLW